MAGVASVLHQVPLGTYTGWNTVASGFYKGHIRTNTGAYIPFAKDQDRAAWPSVIRDRPSEERYGTHETYVAQVRAAAKGSARTVPAQDDADRLIAQAEASKVLK